MGEEKVDGPRPRPLQAVPRAIVPEADGLGGVRVTDDYRGGNPRRAAYRVDDRSQLVRMSHGRLPTPPPPGHTPMSKPIMWPLAPVPEKMADCEPWSDRARARPEAQLSWVAGDGAGQQEWAGTILSSSPVATGGEHRFSRCAGGKRKDGPVGDGGFLTFADGRHDWWWG